MKAIQVHQFTDLPSSLQRDGDVDDVLSMADDVPKPSPKKNQILVKVLACSISPGDVIMARGDMLILRRALPFVPGMDVCGVVSDGNGSAQFKNGDVVVASNGMTPVGGMAEFMAVDEAEAVKLPGGVSRERGASCSSAITARNAVMDHVREGDRVLVLGGSGGVGSAAIQIAKKHGKASFVATTSTQSDMCKELGADRVIDYRGQDWWTMEEFGREKFDVIIDTVGGGNFYGRADRVCKAGKQGGRFVAVTGDVTRPDCRTAWKMLKFFAGMLGRMAYTKMTTRTMPSYTTLFPYDEAKGRREVLGWMEQGTLQIRMDGDPLPFTADSVRKAFVKVGSGHAHGKVCVKVAEDE